MTRRGPLLVPLGRALRDARRPACAALARCAVVATLLAPLLTHATSAHAQPARAEAPPRPSTYQLARPDGEPTEADLERALGLYEDATAELDAARWADAARLFAEVYRLSGLAAALFNHATALRSLGRHRDARDAFRQLLGQHPELSDERRSDAEARMREEAGRVALVLVAGLDDAPNARVTFDGAAVPALSHPVEIETDPGPHAVGVQRPGFSPWRRELTLGDGERETVRVELEALDTEEVYESPWFWTILGAVLLGGGIAIGLLVQDGVQLEPREGFRMFEVRL